MLRVGLTGGIGAGKSTVAAQLRAHGAVLIDADALAREVVEPGTPGLAAIADRFGRDVLDGEGALNRARLGEWVFHDASARADLERITHPRIAARTQELMAQAEASGAAIVVHEVPLLVEKAMQAAYHLVIVVHADAEERLRRIVATRDTTPQDTRARIDSQASDEQRRAVADIWVDTRGAREDTRVEVDRVWRTRLQPFAANLRAGRPASWPAEADLRAPDPTWPQQARRMVQRVRRVLGPDDDVRHVGPTATGMPARDVLELLAAVQGEVMTAANQLAHAGFFAEPLAPGQPGQWRGGSSDPGRPASILVTGRAPARRCVG